MIKGGHSCSFRNNLVSVRTFRSPYSPNQSQSADHYRLLNRTAFEILWVRGSYFRIDTGEFMFNTKSKIMLACVPTLLGTIHIIRQHVLAFLDPTKCQQFFILTQAMTSDFLKTQPPIIFAH